MVESVISYVGLLTGIFWIHILNNMNLIDSDHYKIIQTLKNVTLKIKRHKYQPRSHKVIKVPKFQYY